ncbi:MAG: PA14 domain-containing protein, partial [Verrucomicrobia bacterium]|nr:PA14 domain-containing protein [Verrucomicrobiota bacterium]
MNRFALLLLPLLLTAISTARAEQFSLVVLPDTQGETGATPPTMFTAQCQWITNNAASQNIKMVLHVGDLVNWDTPDSNPPHYMYVNASNGYNMLDAFGIHYANANGNHDNQATGGTNPDGTPCHCSGSAAPGNVHDNLRNTSVMNQFFPQSRFTLCRGLYESNKLENAYHTFSAGGLNWLVINTETDPRQGVVNWFTNVVASHPNHNVIYVTHNFLTSSGSIAGGVGYGDDTPTQVWTQLLNAYSNVRMVFCGHVDTAARRNDVAAHGNHVYSMLSDYQGENAGNGWLRLVNIDTVANTISVQTYSPYTLGSKTDGANQFSFTGVSWVPADPNAGTGLTGEYFGDTNLTTLKLTRTDGSVDFNWGNGFPVPTVGTNNFSVRWSGQVRPEFSETYTFSTITDDGVRLWVNGQLLIDKWVDQAPAEWTGSIALTANQKYSIKMEYYQHAGGACAKLLWRSPSTPRAIIPQTDLFPQPPIPAPPGGLTATPGNAQVALSWSASSGATNYNVKRATVSGGPYTTIASRTTTSYTDATVANGTTYYYVVSASNGGGESANSAQASA